MTDRDIIVVVPVVLGLFLLVQQKLDSKFGVLAVEQIKLLAVVVILHLDQQVHGHL